MNQFWTWVRDQTNDGARTLYLEGVIAEESWLDDDITPEAFKAELMAGSGPVTIWIHSPGGDVFAAAQIYNLLMEYPSDVTVKIDGIAASAASVIAMAGTKVLISPTGMIFIHNPMTLAMGDSAEMQKAIDMLAEVKESIINAYEIRTGLSRAKISHLMDGETWMSAKKAVELGFADGILFTQDKQEGIPDGAMLEDSFTFSRRAVTNNLLAKMRARFPKPEAKTPASDAEVPKGREGIPVESLEKRLFLLSH
jgi:ATP-dependent Clp protease protease subunit